MQHVVELFLGPEDEANNRAYKILQSVHGLEILVAGGGERLSRYVPMPFIVVIPNGSRHYGLTSIQSFANRQQLSSGDNGSGRTEAR